MACTSIDSSTALSVMWDRAAPLSHHLQVSACSKVIGPQWCFAMQGHQSAVAFSRSLGVCTPLLLMYGRGGMMPLVLTLRTVQLEDENAPQYLVLNEAPYMM